MSTPRFLVLELGMRGTPMDLGDGTVIAADRADEIRDVMAEASRKISPVIAEEILAGMGAGARYDVASNTWTGVDLATPARIKKAAKDRHVRVIPPVPQHRSIASNFRPKPRSR